VVLTCMAASDLLTRLLLLCRSLLLLSGLFAGVAFRIPVRCLSLASWRSSGADHRHSGIPSRQGSNLGIPRPIPRGLPKASLARGFGLSLVGCSLAGGSLVGGDLAGGSLALSLLIAVVLCDNGIEGPLGVLAVRN